MDVDSKGAPVFFEDTTLSLTIYVRRKRFTLFWQ